MQLGLNYISTQLLHEKTSSFSSFIVVQIYFPWFINNDHWVTHTGKDFMETLVALYGIYLVHSLAFKILNQMQKPKIELQIVIF